VECRRWVSRAAPLDAHRRPDTRAGRVPGRRGDRLGYRLHTVAGEPEGDLGGVTVAITDRLGDVRVGPHTTTPFPSVELSGGDLGPLRFVAFHSLAPRRRDVPQWWSDVTGVARWCAGQGPVIIAGDFNATLDHSVFRSATTGCSDAAAQRGDGLVPTWPTWLPDWLGPQIDHVIATIPITAESFDVREIPGSDHRAVIARLRVPSEARAWSEQQTTDTAVQAGARARMTASSPHPTPL
jgi:hypothetical protein